MGDILKINFQDELENSYKTYAKAVAIDRALPDIRDGFKPVQRRILYSMYKNGNTNDKPYRKSARIVGDVMGKYHPHGDCLDPSTKLFLASGEIKTIEEVYQEGKDVDIIAYDVKNKTFCIKKAHHFRIGQYTDKVYKISLNNQGEIRVTNNHPILLNNGNYRKAEDLEVKDRLSSVSLFFSQNKDFRPFLISSSVRKQLIQDLFDCPKGLVRHHKDFNFNNNDSSNIDIISRKDHAKIHKDYLTGLALGHLTLQDPKNREILREKNSNLIREYNQNAAWYKFIDILGYLDENYLGLTENNYNFIRPIERSGVYNAPKIETIYDKYAQGSKEPLNCVVNLYKNDFRPIKEKNIRCKEKIKSVNKTIKIQEKKKDNLSNIDVEKCINILGIIYEKQLSITKDSYNTVRNELIEKYFKKQYKYRKYLTYDEYLENKDQIMERFLNEYVYITDIEILEVNQRPMYDFTVDDLENMMIPVSINDNSISLVCVHNSSIYETMCNMSQDYTMNYPFIDGQGNFGSIDGDSPAAMRYTEARLNKTSLLALSSLNKDTVDFIPNFDGSLQEPEVLPNILPNLLLNGSSGIGVGIATNILPFNLKELLDASIKLIESPNCRDSTLFNIIKGPDFPTGAILDPKDINKVYETGRGSFDIYAKINKTKGNLVISEIPYTYSGNKLDLIQEIIKAVDSGKITEIVSIEDRSAKDIEIFLKCKTSSNLDQVITKLYKYTPLKSSVTLNFTGVLKDEIKEFNLREYLEIYVDFVKEIKSREWKFDLGKLLDRQEILHGLIYATENIELIIEIITRSKDRDSAKACMIEGKTKGIKFKTKTLENRASKLRLSEAQAEAILTMRLQSLIGLETLKLREELKDKVAKIKDLNKLLSSEANQNAEIIKILRELKKLDTGRKTEISEDIGKKVDKIIIQTEEKEVIDLVFLLDSLNYVKILDISNYNKLPDKDDYKKIDIKSNERLAIFDNFGDCYFIDFDKINLANFKNSKEPLENLINYDKKLKISIRLIIKEEDLFKEELLIITKKGFGKRLSGEVFKPSGKSKFKKLKASNLDNDDEIIFVQPLEGVEEVEIESDSRILRLKVEEISLQGKQARGNTLMNKKYLPLSYATTSKDEFRAKRVGRRGGAGSKK